MDAFILSVLILYTNGLSDAISIQVASSPDKVAVGGDFTFTCITNARAIYMTRDRTNECLIVGSHPNGTCVFVGDVNLSYRYNCNNSTGVYNLTIPTSVDIESFHESEWRCSAPVDRMESRIIQLYVYVPIKEVIITTEPVDKNPVELLSEKNQLFQCKTNAGRPTSKIQWYISEKNVTGSATPQDDVCIAGCNGKVISSSQLTYIGNMTDNGKIFYCTAFNIKGQLVRSENKSIAILYPPASPSITQIPQGSVDENELIVLTCEILGGNPPATIAWQCNGASPVIHTGIPPTNKTVSSVHLTASKSHNGQVCTCIGSHQAWTQTQSSSITLQIRYATTSSLAVTQTPIAPVREGNKVTLTCEISGGNPLPTIVWQCNGFTTVIPTGIPPADKVVSSIERVVTRLDNGKECLCKGQHHLWATAKEVKHIVIVKYLPAAPAIKQIPQGSVDENELLILTCEILGGNPLANIVWQCDGTSPVIPTVEPTTNKSVSSVQLRATKSNNNQVCTCTGSNPVWTQNVTSSITLQIRYAPTNSPAVTQISSEPVSEGNKVILTCEISVGNPLPTIVWKCNGFTNIIPTDIPPTNTVVSSIERIVTKFDDGKKCVCTCQHPLWTTDREAKYILNVFFKPFLDNTRPYSLSHIRATENKTLQIVITIHAKPPPIIEWLFKAEADWKSCNFSKISSNTTTIGFMTSSLILIDNVQSEDFGDYTFTATNTVGIFFRRFMVTCMEETSLKEEMCEQTNEFTGMFVAGIATLVIGLLSITVAVFFVVRNSLKKKTCESSKSDEYTDVHRNNPAFITDAYSTLQADIVSRPSEEQSSVNTYEECQKKCETHTYSILDDIGSESRAQEQSVNTYEECRKHTEEHSYSSLGTMESERSQPVKQTVNTYEECKSKSEAHAYDTLGKVDSGQKDSRKKQGVYDN